jgi:pimeloyl-ACP methyl ester carboxylesterase
MILAAWIIVEIIFYAIYAFHLKPRAADISRSTSQPYRGSYNQQCHPHRRHHLLFLRILDRLEAMSRLGNTNSKTDFNTFLRSWFSFEGKHETKDIQKSNDNKISIECARNTDHAIIDHDGIQEFFSWAFFNKFPDHLENWERDEMKIMINILKEKYDIVYPKNTRASSDDKDYTRLKPRRCTLEQGNPLHRPFVLYLGVWILRQFSYNLLRFLGYQRFHAECDSTGKALLPYWFKPGCGDMIDTSAILFFHGITPAGIVGYLPFLRYCLLTGKRNHSSPVFLFENLPITYHLSFEALSEEETVYGVEQALRFHGFCENNCKLTLCGHSFGTFQLTWLLNAKRIRPMIHKFILLDPVSILLSNSDLVLNVLYGGGDASKAADEAASRKNKNRLIIRAAATSELFIEHYLRRRFAWYNSELWIEDIPDHVEVHIFLAEHDSIINAGEVRQELDRHRLTKSIQYTFWEGHAHGDCITNPKLWTDVSSSFKTHSKVD